MAKESGEKMDKIYYNQSLKPKDQELRKEMTPQERHLWYDFLKDHPFQFRRQKQFARYIVDFYCSEAKLVIELDGAPHFTEEGKIRDHSRDAYFASIGIRVIRFSNSEVDKHFKVVCARIDSELDFVKNQP